MALGMRLGKQQVAIVTRQQLSTKMAAYIATHDRSVLPKRYEDTKVSVNQKATHRNILGIGSDIYQKICTEHENDLQVNVAAVEEKVWKEAVRQKEAALKEAKEAAELEQDRAMATAKKAQEKAVKSESKRIEALMKKLAAQQVQQEKEEGDKRLQEALKKAREEFEVEKAGAVKKSREEEKVAAAAEAKRVAGLEGEKRKNIMLAAEKEKQQALKTLKERLKQEEKEAVKKVEERCKKEEEQNLKQLQESHQGHVNQLEEKTRVERGKTEIVQAELEKTVLKKKNVEDKLRNLAVEFQDFIDFTRGFDEGQADFMIPDPLKDLDFLED